MTVPVRDDVTLCDRPTDRPVHLLWFSWSR